MHRSWMGPRLEDCFTTRLSSKLRCAICQIAQCGAGRASLDHRVRPSLKPAISTVLDCMTCMFYNFKLPFNESEAS